MKASRASISLLCSAALLWSCSSAQAQTFNGLGFTGPESDGRPGEYYFYKGVEAVRKKDYELAVQMYQVSASWAYKMAEYNLGVMYLHGEGVPVDRPRAMAWIALAAERDNDKYVDARERVYAELTPDEFAKANEIWRDLKPTYGDASALRRAKAQWAETKNSATGSHLGFIGNVAVGSDAGRPYAFAMPSRTPPAKGKMAISGESMGFVPDGFAFSSFGFTGGEQIDGTIAYKQFQMSDNPYDPIFEHGIATVGPLIQAGAKKDAETQTPSDAAVPAKQNF
jgi:Sel1 repeat